MKKKIDQWNSKKCDMYLKLAISRLKLQKIKTIEITNSYRKLIADLLMEEKDKMAQIKTITLVHEDYMIEVFSILELYCSTLLTRLNLISLQKECPDELKTAVCSIIFAAPQLYMEELLYLRKLFLLKYGNRFACNCVDFHCINPKLQLKLKRNKPSDEILHLYLLNIIQKYEISSDNEISLVYFLLNNNNNNNNNMDTKSSNQPNDQNNDNDKVQSTPPEKHIQTIEKFEVTPDPKIIKIEDDLANRLQNLISFDNIPPLPPANFAPTSSTPFHYPPPIPMPQLPQTTNDFAFPQNISFVDQNAIKSNATLSSSSSSYHPSSSTPLQYNNNNLNNNNTSNVNNTVININKSIGSAESAFQIYQKNNEGKVIVMVNGSNSIKCGFSGDYQPISITPNIFGSPKLDDLTNYWQLNEQNDINDGNQNIFYGNDAKEKRGLLALKRTMEKGFIVDWNAIEQIWRQIFDVDLSIIPSHHPILLSIPYLTSPSLQFQKRTFLQILFEKFDFKGVQFVDEATSILYATGKSSGVVIDFGFDEIKIIPIVNNSIIQSAVNLFPIGGVDIDHYLSSILTRETSYTFTSSSELDILQEIKENYCYLALNDRDLNADPKIYHLPDGQELNLNATIFTSPPEIIFTPSLIGRNDLKGIQHQILQSIMKIPTTYRTSLLQNIILVGGGSKIANFKQRLHNEMSKLLPPQFHLPSLITFDCDFPSFASCSRLIDDRVITSFITKENYYQYGANSLIPD